MFRLISDARKQDWAHARSWLWATLAAGCIGFWGLPYVLLLITEHVSWRIYTDHAELAIYTAGILAPTIPMLLGEMKGPRYVHPKGAILWIVFLLLAIALTFVGVCVAEALSHPVNGLLLLIASCFLFVSGVTTAFFVELGQSLSISPNIGAERKNQVDELGASVLQALEAQHDN